jgi:hypothetical protein
MTVEIYRFYAFEFQDLNLTVEQINDFPFELTLKNSNGFWRG